MGRLETVIQLAKITIMILVVCWAVVKISQIINLLKIIVIEIS